MKLVRKSGALAALLFAVTVEAQTAPPAPTIAAQTASPAPLSVSEMRDRTEAFKSDIEENHRQVLHLQALVRKQKDVIRLTCVNDKLVQMNAQMNIFDTAALQLEGTGQTADEGSRAAYAEIEKAATDIKKLRDEAEGCAGELEMYKQESRSDVSRPDLDDPTDGGPFHSPEVLGEPEIDVPGYATPFR
jgi:hypothetical protein